MFIVAILLPPLAMFLKGRPVQAVLCFLLMITVIGWPIAAIWALLVVSAANADSRTKKLEKAIRESADAQTEATIRMQQAQAEAQAAAADAAAAQAATRAAQAKAASAEVASLENAKDSGI
jgi:hypothetical protein